MENNFAMASDDDLADFIAGRASELNEALYVAAQRGLHIQLSASGDGFSSFSNAASLVDTARGVSPGYEQRQDVGAARPAPFVRVQLFRRTPLGRDGGARQ